MGTAFDAELHEQTEQLIIHVPEEATPGQSLTQRRVATRWILITPVAIVVLCTLAALSYGPSTVAELSTSTEEVEEIVQEPGYPQQPREWLSEDEELRHYAWTTPQPHTSLQDVLDSLNPLEIQTRAWILESRTTSRAGVGVGLGSTDPPRDLKPGSPARRHKAFPEEAEGPGSAVYGSPEKYYALLEEWRTGQPVETCPGGEWQDEYSRLHADVLKRRSAPRLIEYACRGEHCGGIADRLLGMTSVLLFGILSKRAISISWDQPCPFDLIFDSPHVDWSRKYPDAATPDHPIYDDFALLRRRKDVSFMNAVPAKIDKLLERGDFLRETRDDSRPWIRIESNRGMVLTSFKHPAMAKELHEIGLRDTTAYACLLSYLIRPRPSVSSFINQYASLFALPSVFSIGIQIRTGDYSMRYSDFDADNTVEKHSQYFTCAEQVARTYAHPAQRVVYYLISDSRTLREDALQKFPDQVIASGLEQSHMEIAAGSGNNSAGWATMKDATDGMMRTVAESWTFAETDFSILTLHSGFGKIPTWLRGREGRTIQLFNEHLDPVYTATFNGRLPAVPDCSLHTTLSTFSGMANDWSLG